MNILYKIFQQLKLRRESIQFIVDISITIFCFLICFFKPLRQSIIQKIQKRSILNRQLFELQQEYDILQEKMKCLKQSKKKHQQQVKTLRQEISWSTDFLTLSKQGEDVTYLEEYRRKLEAEWNRCMEEDSDAED